jgi:hypothetical protein
MNYNTTIIVMWPNRGPAMNNCFHNAVKFAFRTPGRSLPLEDKRFCNLSSAILVSSSFKRRCSTLNQE